MTEREQAEQVLNDLLKVVERTRNEYNLSYATLLGVIRMVGVCLEAEWLETLDEDEEEGED